MRFNGKLFRRMSYLGYQTYLLLEGDSMINEILQERIVWGRGNMKGVEGGGVSCLVDFWLTHFDFISFKVGVTSFFMSER